MKSLSALAIASSVGGAISLDGLLVILGAVVTIINIVIEVIKALQKQREKKANDPGKA